MLVLALDDLHQAVGNVERDYHVCLNRVAEVKIRQILDRAQVIILARIHYDKANVFVCYFVEEVGAARFKGGKSAERS